MKSISWVWMCVLVLPIVAAGQEVPPEPVPAEPEAPTPDAPAEDTDDDTPEPKDDSQAKPAGEAEAKPEAPKKKKELAPLTLDVASLPEPFVGVEATDDVIVEAMKLVEAQEFDHALARIEKTLKAEAKNVKSERIKELRVGKALVLLRSGKLAEAQQANQSLIATKDSVKESSVRDRRNIARIGQALRAAQSELASRSKEERAEAYKPDEWRGVLEKAGDRLARSHGEDVDKASRHIKKHDWSDALKRIMNARETIEALDCIRDTLAPGVWDDAARLHHSTMSDLHADIRAEAPKLKKEWENIQHHLHRSSVYPDRWWPMGEVRKYQLAREKLIEGRDVAKALADHSAKSSGRWGSPFGGLQNNPVHENMIPEQRVGTTVNK